MQQSDWDKEQVWERNWHGKCLNTFGEEAKQITYAHRMGLINRPQDGKWPVYDANGKSILDIGGGPVSLLLKTVNRGLSLVIDPCSYPEWVKARYKEAKIHYPGVLAEDYVPDKQFDEVWIYNVLQHVKDPAKVLEVAKASTSLIRLFDWIDTPVSPGHPHTITEQFLQKQLNNLGTVEVMKGENGCTGRAFYGVFKV